MVFMQDKVYYIQEVANHVASLCQTIYITHKYPGEQIGGK